jgi:hypothetical protein
MELLFDAYPIILSKLTVLLHFVSHLDLHFMQQSTTNNTIIVV